jgi:hypothetical protein
MPSRRLSVVELQNAAKPLAHDDTPSGSRWCASRERNEVVEALVSALGVIVLDELLHDTPQVTLAKRDHVSQALLPYGTNEPSLLRIKPSSVRSKPSSVGIKPSSGRLKPSEARDKPFAARHKPGAVRDRPSPVRR